MSRRHILAGIAAVAVAGAGGAGVAAPALPANDARLLALSHGALRAAEQERVAYSQGQDDAAAAAFGAWEAALLAMAEIPASGLPGVAAKALHVVRCLRIGDAEADRALARSLRDDLERLVPALALVPEPAAPASAVAPGLARYANPVPWGAPGWEEAWQAGRPVRLPDGWVQVMEAGTVAGPCATTPPAPAEAQPLPLPAPVRGGRT